MRFSEIVGNREGAEHLKKQVQGGHPFHAYIFDGAEGIGKRRLAYTFAQALVCREAVNGEPCGKCDACKKAESGNHGDIHYITSDGSSVKDEQLEAMQEVFASKPFDSDKSILIIDKADTMTTRAQNRMLKTLEEPGESTIIIMLTERISEMLPTIVSRSLVIKMKPANMEEIKAFLVNESGADEEAVEIAAAYSYGCPGKGLRLLKDEEFRRRREKSIECSCLLLEKKTMSEFVQLINEMELQKEDALELLDMMSFWFRDLMLISQGVGSEYIMNRDYIDRLAEQCKKTGIKKICKAIEKIEEGKYDIMMNLSTIRALKNIYLEINLRKRKK